MDRGILAFLKQQQDLIHVQRLCRINIPRMIRFPLHCFGQFHSFCRICIYQLIGQRIAQRNVHHCFDQPCNGFGISGTVLIQFLNVSFVNLCQFFAANERTDMMFDDVGIGIISIAALHPFPDVIFKPIFQKILQPDVIIHNKCPVCKLAHCEFSRILSFFLRCKARIHFLPFRAVLKIQDDTVSVFAPVTSFEHRLHIPVGIIPQFHVKYLHPLLPARTNRS